MGQLNNRFHHVWYGTCGEHGDGGCKPFVFADNPQLLQNVEMISAFSKTTNNSLKYYKPGTNEGDLTSMECGGMYSIVLRDHTQALVIPGVTAAGPGTTQNQDGTTSAVKVSFTCDDIYVEPTPTPTPVVCIPETAEIAKAFISSQDQSENFAGNIYRFRGFEGDELGLDISNTLPAPNSVLRVAIPSQNFVGNIAISGSRPASSTHYMYLSRGDACYRGEINDSKIQNNTWYINMELIFGEEPVMPTPTPKPPTPETPTPTPIPETPTPTPTPKPPVEPVDCCEDGFTELTVSDGPQSQSYTHNESGRPPVDTFKYNMIYGGTICVDTTPDNGVADVNTLEPNQKLYLSDNPSQQIGVFSKLIRNSSNTIYYNTNGKCYKGTWNSASSQLTLNLQS